MSAPEEVIAAVARGWSVIPVAADKRPIVKWKPYQTERADVEQVEAWASGQQPAAWAVITGAISGLVILDFDGDAGQQRLAEYAMTPHVRTGSGGHHVYFEHPGRPVGTLNGQAAHDLGKRFPGLDIRGDGGYACFHGRNGSGPYRLDRVDPEPWEAVPEPVRAFLGLAAENEPRDPSDLVSEALRRVAGGEGRNNAGFWLACQLRDAGCSYADSERLLGEYATKVPASNAKGEPYSAQEARESVRSAYNKPARAQARPGAPGRYKVTWTEGKTPKLVLPQIPAEEDPAGLCAWLTVVFNLNPAHPVTGGQWQGVRGPDGQIVLRRADALSLRFEPARAINNPQRLYESFTGRRHPGDRVLYAFKADHCREIAHVVEMLCDASAAKTEEQEACEIVGVLMSSALAVEGHAIHGTTAQRYEAAQALRRERGSDVRYLVDSDTGQIVIAAADLAEAARRSVGSSIARGWLDARMDGIGWKRITLEGRALPGRSGRGGPHAIIVAYCGHVQPDDSEGSVTK